MDLLSLISGTNNLRRLSVIVGILLILFGVIYPFQKGMELQEKINLTNESLGNLKDGAKYLSDHLTTICANSRKFDSKIVSLKLTKDSLLKRELNDNTKFLIKVYIDEISKIQTESDSEQLSYFSKFYKFQENTNKAIRLKSDIKLLSDSQTKLNWLSLICCVIGGLLFGSGIYKWIESQKKLELLNDIEISIKQEELKKLELENKKASLEVNNQNNNQSPAVS